MIDTHCHIYYDVYSDDIDKVVENVSIGVIISDSDPKSSLSIMCFITIIGSIYVLYRFYSDKNRIKNNHLLRLLS